MAKSAAQIRANAKYDKKTYDPIQIKPKKDEAAFLRKAAAARGESLTRYVMRCATEREEREKENRAD